MQRSVVQILQTVPEVVEAHLPQCYVPSMMTTAAQVLVIVAHKKEFESVLQYVQERVARLLTPGGHLDIWPLPPESALLPAVRAAGCRIFERRPQDR